MAQTTKERRATQRRRAERVRAKNGWTVTLNSMKSCDIGNLSLYGLFAMTKKELPVDTDVKVRFKPPEKIAKAFTVNSKVVWSRKDRDGKFLGLGVEFIDVTKENQQAIAEYVKIIKKERDERS